MFALLKLKSLKTALPLVLSVVLAAFSSHVGAAFGVVFSIAGLN